MGERYADLDIEQADERMRALLGLGVSTETDGTTNISTSSSMAKTTSNNVLFDACGAGTHANGVAARARSADSS